MTSRTNLGPLTEAFTYPASCTVAVQACPTCDVFWQAQTCSDNGYNTQGVEDNTRCWPTRSGSDISTGVALGGWGFYSPGLSCPVGYATSCVATASVDGGSPFQFPLEAGETAIGCCPTGFQCLYNPGQGKAQTCYSVVTKNSFAAVTCSSGTSNGFNYFNVPATTTITDNFGDISTATISPVTVYAPLIQLMHQSTDLAQRSSASVTPTTTPQSNPPSNESGLSTGAKVGIGVGVGVAALLLSGVAVGLIIRKRKQKSSYANEIMTFEPKPQQQHPQPGYQGVPQQPMELDSYSTRAELPS